MTDGPQSSVSSNPAPAGITQAEFALRRRVSEAMVSRWKARGYLVLDEVGRVLEAETTARLAAMLDPGRGGDRTGKPKTAPAPAYAPASSAAPGPGIEPPAAEQLVYQHEAARDKRASAQQRELALAKEAGELVPAAEVEARIAHHVRAALDQMASRRRRLAPKLALESDARKVEQVLEESDREFCRALAGIVAPAAPASEAA